jgi:hypothetical protein
MRGGEKPLGRDLKRPALRMLAHSGDPPAVASAVDAALRA